MTKTTRAAAARKVEYIVCYRLPNRIVSGMFFQARSESDARAQYFEATRYDQNTYPIVSVRPTGN